MTVIHLPSPLMNRRMQTAWQDYQEAYQLFMRDWHDPAITERYIEATRRWLDANVEEADSEGEL